MKRIIHFLSVIVVLSVALSACQGVAATQPPPQPTEAPVTEPPVTEIPATEPPATEIPTLEPVDLAGPLMELGSKYMYVDGSILVAVPGGPFLMGSNDFGEKEHKVTVGDFWIYSDKVTNGQYARCLESGQCTSPDLKNNKSFNNRLDINLPVTGVNYDQGVAYCTFVHGRLPTEAEWEKTARGPDGSLFPWGDALPACDLLNFNFCKGKPTDVTTYLNGVSYYGAFDMSGNVREWVADWFSADYYNNSPDENPIGPELGQKRSVRGSTFGDGADSTFSARRFQFKPTESRNDLGFRCVVEDPTFFAPYCQTFALYGADAKGDPTNTVIPLPDNCVQPKLSITEDCKSQAMYVTIDTYPLPQGAQLDVPADCTGGPPTYKCVGTGQVSITPKTCTVPPPPGGGQCGPGYNYDGQSNSCSGKGPGVNCMPGFNFNAATQCCTAADPAAKVYGLCPPGFYQQDNACVSAINNSPGLQTVVEDFHPISSCYRPHGPGDPVNPGDPGNPGGSTTTCVPVCTKDRLGNLVCTSCP